jgi:hypothetical protein
MMATALMHVSEDEEEAVPELKPQRQQTAEEILRASFKNRETVRNHVHDFNERWSAVAASKLKEQPGRCGSASQSPRRRPREAESEGRTSTIKSNVDAGQRPANEQEAVDPFHALIGPARVSIGTREFVTSTFYSYTDLRKQYLDQQKEDVCSGPTILPKQLSGAKPKAKAVKVVVTASPSPRKKVGPKTTKQTPKAKPSD